jgi:NNP family nitrate/nitrite transporter-like MFS transporter
MTQKNESGYGWVIITFGAFINIAISLSYMCMPVLFSEISQDLGLSLVELGVVWGMIGFGSMFMSFFGGPLGDKYGTKRVIFMSCILAGITGALRGFSPNFFWLALTTCLFGLSHITVVLNIHKTTGVWFTGKKVVIANGIVCTTVGVGMMISAGISDTIVSPLVGGWKNVFLLYGALCIGVGLLWVIVTRPDPVHHIEGQPVNAPAFLESFSKVLHTKVIWLKALMNMFFFGSFMGLTGFLSLYLRKIGWLPVAADGALAVLNGASIFTAIPLAILAGKIKSKKSLIFYLICTNFLCVSLIPFFNGLTIWVLVFLFGAVRDGYVAILTTMIIETKGIGARYAGTAIGVVFSFGNLGIFLISTMGNALANINLRFAFILWALFFGTAMLILHAIKDTDNTASASM